MILIVRVTEVCRWLFSELSANSLVRRIVVLIIYLVERRVLRQSAHALDAAQLVKNSPCHGQLIRT